MSRYDELRRLAEEATPGPWTIFEGWDAMRCVATLADNRHQVTITRDDQPAFNVDADAAYIAAASPDTITALLDERDRLLADIASIEAAFDATHLIHDTAYEDFAELVNDIFYQRREAKRLARPPLHHPYQEEE